MNKEKIMGILKEKVVPMLKTKVGVGIITGFICFNVGGIVATDVETVPRLESTIADQENELLVERDKVSTLEGELNSLKGEMKGLEAKVEEAKPFFDMAEAEKKALEQEAEKKAAALKAEEERLAKEEEQKKKDAMSVTLGNGTYLVGKDIPEGVYDLFAVKGGGNVQSSDYKVNLIMGTKGDSDFYQREVQNVALKEGKTIELNRVTVKFVPDFDYEVVK